MHKAGHISLLVFLLITWKRRKIWSVCLICWGEVWYSAVTQGHSTIDMLQLNCIYCWDAPCSLFEWCSFFSPSTLLFLVHSTELLQNW